MGFGLQSNRMKCRMLRINRAVSEASGTSSDSIVVPKLLIFFQERNRNSVVAGEPFLASDLGHSLHPTGRFQNLLKMSKVLDLYRQSTGYVSVG